MKSSLLLFSLCLAAVTATVQAERFRVDGTDGLELKLTPVVPFVNMHGKVAYTDPLERHKTRAYDEPGRWVGKSLIFLDVPGHWPDYVAMQQNGTRLAAGALVEQVGTVVSSRPLGPNGDYSMELIVRMDEGGTVSVLGEPGSVDGVADFERLADLEDQLVGKTFVLGHRWWTASPDTGPAPFLGKVKVTGIRLTGSTAAPFQIWVVDEAGREGGLWVRDKFNWGHTFFGPTPEALLLDDDAVSSLGLTAAMRAHITCGEAVLGMTKGQAVLAWGPPLWVDREGNTEQWDYGRGYLGFTGPALTSASSWYSPMYRRPLAYCTSG